MDSNQDQGIDEFGPRPTDEVMQTHRERESSLKDRSKTVNDRLDKFFDSQPHEEVSVDREASKGTETKTEEPIKEKKSTKTPEPVPSSNQQVESEDRVEKTVSPAEVKTEAPEKVELTQTEDELPDNASDRTKRNFERMREAKRQAEEEKLRLEQEVARLRGSTNTGFNQPSYQAPINPQVNYLPPQQVQAIQNQFVQPDGSVDIDGLNKALYSANVQAANAIAQANLARQEVQREREERARFDEERQLKDAHQKYPELDPESMEFDENFRDLVSVQLAKNRMAGKNLSLAEVAEQVQNRYKPSTPRKEEQVKAEKVKLQKQAQAPLESSQGESRQEATMETLREQTRRGGLENQALNERMRKLGIIS